MALPLAGQRRIAMVEPAHGAKMAEQVDRGNARQAAAGPDRPHGTPEMPAGARQAPRLSICNWNGR